MQGAIARAASNASDTLRSEAPTAACRMSGHVIGRKRTPNRSRASAATARTRAVLPVPDGPRSMTPPDRMTPSLRERSGLTKGSRTVDATSATTLPYPGSGLYEFPDPGGHERGSGPGFRASFSADTTVCVFRRLGGCMSMCR
eukprot:scaffold1954_cov268-Pinguiococcus_pyrenoidosus.AAC.217